MGKRKRRNNSQKNILLLLFFILGISIAYASFSQNLNVIGTANTNGKFNVEFSSSKIVDSKGINVLASKAEILDDKSTLMINIKDMEYPGSGATISCVIKNTGTIPAKLNDMIFTGNDDPDISISFMNSEKKGQTIQPNEQWTIKFMVKWNIESTLDINKAVNFNVKLNFVQDVEEYNPKI